LTTSRMLLCFLTTAASLYLRIVTLKISCLVNLLLFNLSC
jgi:hypothetical protein